MRMIHTDVTAAAHGVTNPDYAYVEPALDATFVTLTFSQHKTAEEHQRRDDGLDAIRTRIRIDLDDADRIITALTNAVRDARAYRAEHPDKAGNPNQPRRVLPVEARRVMTSTEAS